MSAGAEVFNGLGEQTLRITDRLTRLVNMIYIAGSGSITDGAFALGVVFYTFSPIVGDTAGPTFSLSGNTLSWTFDGSFASPGYLTYGLF